MMHEGNRNAAVPARFSPRWPTERVPYNSPTEDPFNTTLSAPEAEDLVVDLDVSPSLDLVSIDDIPYLCVLRFTEFDICGVAIFYDTVCFSGETDPV